MEEDVEFRQGLPLDYLTYMGVQNSDKVQNQILFEQLCTFSSSRSPLCCFYCLSTQETTSPCAGRPTQVEILLTNRQPDEEADRLRTGGRSCGSESQRLPPRLPASCADTRYVTSTSACNHVCKSSRE